MPDFRYRVRQTNDYYVVVKADSFEDGLDFLADQLEKASSPVEQVNLHHVAKIWETDGGDQLPDDHRYPTDLHQTELVSHPELDTEGSASRQNWIETGLYLTHNEAGQYAS
jgi:hypothetical protein